MKYIPKAIEFGIQSRSSSLILYMIFENCGSWPEIKNFDLVSKLQRTPTFMKFDT